jgi:hypothetical protein
MRITRMVPNLGQKTSVSYSDFRFFPVRPPGQHSKWPASPTFPKKWTFLKGLSHGNDFLEKFLWLHGRQVFHPLKQ